MKANFKYVMLLAAALTMGMSSCSNEDDAAGDTSKEGAKTYASIKFSSPVTYGTPQAGTTEESKINTVDVFIYNAGGFLKDHKQFTGFTETAVGSGVWETTDLMETTTGAKQVYLGINLPAAISTSLSVTNKTLTALTSVAQAITVADIATNNNFVMGSDVTNATFTDWDGNGATPAANALTVNVKRFASKISVEKKAGLVLANIDGGTMSSLEFALGQLNQSTYAVQKKVGTTIEDPNFAAPATPGDGLTGAPVAADYSTVNAAGIAINTLDAKYAPENTNNNTVAGNLTYTSVSAEFLPEKVVTGTTGAWSVVTNPVVVPADFWCIKTSTGNLYFNTQTEVDDYATEFMIPAADVVKYTDGTCYYTVFVNKAKNYDLFRNDFYRVTIDEILGLGDSAPGPKNPTVPVDVTTQIKISVDVTPWNLESEDVSLTPQ